MIILTPYRHTKFVAKSNHPSAAPYSIHLRLRPAVNIVVARLIPDADRHVVPLEGGRGRGAVQAVEARRDDVVAVLEVVGEGDGLGEVLEAVRLFCAGYLYQNSEPDR